MTKTPGADKLEIRELIERSMQLRHHIERRLTRTVPMAPAQPVRFSTVGLAAQPECSVVRPQPDSLRQPHTRRLPGTNRSGAG